MKKIMMCSFLTVLLCVLTVGCGGSKKTVVCTNEDKQTGMTAKETITGKFEGNKVTEVDMAIDFELEDDYVEYIDTFYETVEKQFKEIEGDGIKINVSKGEKSISAKATVNPDKVSDDNALGITGNTSTPEEMKESFEEQGYTCK